MKITLLMIGVTDKKYIREGIEDYRSRLVHYLPFEIRELPDIKNSRNLSADQQKELEGKLLLAQLTPGDELILLDERGLELSSPGLAVWMEKKMVSGLRNLVLVIGGPYGFSEVVSGRANAKLSLSRLTFPHQLVRLIVVEQLYRAQTIIRGEPYHHA